MTSPPPAQDVVSTHLSFLDRLAKRLREHPFDTEPLPQAPVLDALPGLQVLFDSIVTASETPRRVACRDIEEWNPLAQRMLLSHEGPLPATALEAEFSLVPSYVQTFVEWAHEAVHILALEAWFLGRSTIDSEHEFVRWYLAAEGLAFWYADIVVTRRVRETIPNADLVFCRSSVSNAGFHPEQALAALGLRSDVELLPIYLRAFLGEDVGLDRIAHPFAATLGTRLREFYQGSLSTLPGLYEILRSFGLFDGYRARFCAVEGLPSLIPVAQPAGDPIAFLTRVGLELLPQLVPSPEVARVRVRRAIQTRAYHAWVVHRMVERDWVFGSGFDPLAVMPGLARYLDAQEAHLHALADGASSDEVQATFEEDDARYETEVRAHFLACGAHTRYRYRIFPFFGPTGGVVGLWDVRTAFSLAEAEAVARFVFGRSAWDVELVSSFARFLEACCEERADDTVQDAFNHFMTHPAALVAWSLPMGAVSPLHGEYRELPFEFH